MGKFLRLVQNEHIKIFSRVSTWILVILMVVVSVGYHGFMKFAQYQMNNYSYVEDIDDVMEGYKNEIQYLEAEKSAGYEYQVQAYEFLIAHQITYNDWRNTEVFSQFNNKASLDAETAAGNLTEAELAAQSKEIQDNLDLLAKNDWKGYYENLIRYNEGNAALTAEEKENANFYHQYAVENNLDPSKEDWRATLAQEIQGLRTEISTLEQSTQQDPEAALQLEKRREELLLCEYRLEHQIQSYAQQISFNEVQRIDFWTVLGLSNIMIGVVSMIIIIFAGSSIANEFSTGTVKFLLINPVKRWKIFLSKYVTILSMSIMLVLAFFVTNTLCSGLFFGLSDIIAPYLYVSNGAVHSLPGLLFILWQYLLGSVNLVVMGTLAFAISSLLRNSAVAIGVSVFVMLAGSTIIAFMSALQLDWARFFIFANTDLNAIINGSSSFPNMTVGFSLSVIAVHMIIFFLTAWDGFMRRESI